VAYSEQGTAVCAGLGLALWVVVGVALITTDPDGGANIGAGAIGVVALALSVLAASSVATTARTPTGKAVGRACIIGWVLWFVLSVTDAVPWEFLVALGVLSFGLLAWCFVLALRLPGRRSD
jgi:hypothetical protein